MKSKFIQDVEAFAMQIVNQLSETNEGGIILVATVNMGVVQCIACQPSQRKIMVENLLLDDDIQEDIRSIINDNL